ncbi:hypothetical protein [Enterocloster bolteae]|uniref:hypothetical protein n=2 Tax=Enterocloster bolteae TaxID=208479 RepID=UPI001896B12D|nr:hypothetical protein [Enterocloster bolteae]
MEKSKYDEARLSYYYRGGGDEKIKQIIKLMKILISKYELKHPENESPVYICENINTRNRYKNERYKIPEDQPQCPVYKDNRCCGGCKLAPECEHCVDCGCYGFTKVHMGGTDKNYYLHKASNNYGIGRIGKDGKFDWNYYYFNKKRKELKVGKYILQNNKIYEIKSSPSRNGKFTALEIGTDNYVRLNINEMENYMSTYDSKEQLMLYNKMT